jgi:hypothetical protein
MPGSIRPSLVPAEGILKMQKFRLLPRHPVDTDDIESHRRPLLLRQQPEVVRRQPAQNNSFVPVDRGFGRSHVLRGSRLDFDEAKHGSLPGNQIDVARPLAAGPAPRHHNVSLAAQVKENRIFSLCPGKQMGGKRLPSAAGRNAPQSGHNPLHGGNAWFCEGFHGETILG